MRDILIEQDENSVFDIGFENGDFKLTNGLDSVIFLSLFSDKRAEESEVALPELRRGWAGNELNNDPNFEYGSKLWLLDQSRVTQSTLNKAISFANESLQHLITKGIVQDVNVQGEIVNNNINLTITFIRNDNSVDSVQYNLWENTNIV